MDDHDIEWQALKLSQFVAKGQDPKRWWDSKPFSRADRIRIQAVYNASG